MIPKVRSVQRWDQLCLQPVPEQNTVLVNEDGTQACSLTACLWLLFHGNIGVELW